MLILTLLSALKKKHSKTGEESRFQGTILGKSAEERPIVIEGGAESIKAWTDKVRARAQTSEHSTPTISSLSSNISTPDNMDI